MKLSLPIYKQFVSRVITRTRKPRKMVGNFPVREKSENFEQTAKVRENHTKYWKSLGISDKCYLLFFELCIILVKMDQVFT